MLASLTVHMLTGAVVPTVQMESVWLVGQISTPLLSFIFQRILSSFTLATETVVLTLILRLLVLLDLDSRLPDKRILEKFPTSQHQPSLITPPRFTSPVPSMFIKRWSFHKAKWSHYIALTNKFDNTAPS